MRFHALPRASTRVHALPCAPIRFVQSCTVSRELWVASQLSVSTPRIPQLLLHAARIKLRPLADPNAACAILEELLGMGSSADFAAAARILLAEGRKATTGNSVGERVHRIRPPIG